MLTAEMTSTGQMLIGASAVRGSESALRAVDPATGKKLEPEFGGGSAADVDAACTLADKTFDDFRAVSADGRAKFLETIAEGIPGLGDSWIERVMAESA